jgi:hypothetical protein
MSGSVFVVTEGEYSSYGIIAVFATREEAEAFIPDARREAANHDRDDRLFRYASAEFAA